MSQLRYLHRNNSLHCSFQFNVEWAMHYIYASITICQVCFSCTMWQKKIKLLGTNCVLQPCQRGNDYN